MARPKSDKPTKSIIKSVRLTPDQHDKIIKEFGSIQKALEFVLSKIK